MRCKCSNKVIQKSRGAVKVRVDGPIYFKDGACMAKCFWCKDPIELPLQLKEGVNIVNERFILRK